MRGGLVVCRAAHGGHDTRQTGSRLHILPDAPRKRRMRPVSQAAYRIWAGPAAELFLKGTPYCYDINFEMNLWIRIFFNSSHKIYSFLQFVPVLSKIKTKHPTNKTGAKGSVFFFFFFSSRAPFQKTKLCTSQTQTQSNLKTGSVKSLFHSQSKLVNSW